MNIFNDDLDIAEEIYFVISNKTESSKKCEFELEQKSSLNVAQIWQLLNHLISS